MSCRYSSLSMRIHIKGCKSVKGKNKDGVLKSTRSSRRNDKLAHKNLKPVLGESNFI